MLKIMPDPLVGLVALLVLLLALFGRVRMPFGLPGALASALAGPLIFWGRAWLDLGPGATIAAGSLRPALPWPTLGWIDAVSQTLAYLSIALPFALVAIIGGIDNTESAAAAGDEYRARDILLTEAAATMLAGCCGGVVQNTPYIGHPAYKAMGARAGYTLATGLGLGAGGDHRSPIGARGAPLRGGERGVDVRRDPFPTGQRRALLALGAALGDPGPSRRRLRRSRGPLLGRRDAESSNNCLTSFVRGVLNGFRFVNAVTIVREEAS